MKKLSKNGEFISRSSLFFNMGHLNKNMLSRMKRKTEKRDGKGRQRSEMNP
ncbi:hypothetical protein [Halalkalibacter alkalisediminis]|uniref:Uncharacterized protein n=1 Tax=Halalkalibacter alkalisediminis TaxID=935616 RepID=A0ABV6NBL0_9BACI|nr:hypothetical protein [Halalkalibacter alkalisediminis]